MILHFEIQGQPDTELGRYFVPSWHKAKKLFFTAIKKSDKYSGFR